MLKVLPPGYASKQSCSRGEGQENHEVLWTGAVVGLREQDPGLKVKNDSLSEYYMLPELQVVYWFLGICCQTEMQRVLAIMGTLRPMPTELPELLSRE